MPSGWNNDQQERSFLDTLKAAAIPAFQGWNSTIIWTFAGKQLPWDPSQENTIPADGVIRIKCSQAEAAHSHGYLSRQQQQPGTDPHCSQKDWPRAERGSCLLLFSPKLGVHLSSLNISQFYSLYADGGY